MDTLEDIMFGMDNKLDCSVCPRGSCEMHCELLVKYPEGEKS